MHPNCIHVQSLMDLIQQFIAMVDEMVHSYTFIFRHIHAQ